MGRRWFIEFIEGVEREVDMDGWEEVVVSRSSVYVLFIE